MEGVIFSSLSVSQVAVPDLAEAVKGADILIFVVPHQFIVRVCDTIKDHIKPDTVGMSLIKVGATSHNNNNNNTFNLYSAFLVLKVASHTIKSFNENSKE